MYSSRGSSAYGQSFSGQNLGSAYSGGSVGGHEVGQQALASRHPSVLGAHQDADVGGYRGHTSSATHYGGQYSYVYGSATLNSGQKIPPLSAKESVPSTLESRGGYVSGIRDSPKFATGDYVPSSSHGYGHKVDNLYADKVSDYPAIERRQYTERQTEYVGRDLHGEPTGRYMDSVGYGHRHQQPEIYDRADQSSLLRQAQLLRAQSLQSASLDGNGRQIDSLAVRGAGSRHSTQDLISFGGPVDADPLSSSMLSSTSYSVKHAQSISGAAPRTNAEDVMYGQSASNPGYGVSLPPGRDYATRKGLHGNSLDINFPGNLLSHGGHNEHKDERAGYLREFELREEERRQERMRERERDREREKERERSRKRERVKERKREFKMKRQRERKPARALEIKRERTPPARSARRETLHHEAPHRLQSPVKEKKREYVCKLQLSSLIEVERDYLSIDRRYPKLFVSPELSKVVVNWPKENLKLSIHTPVSFEHDFIEGKSVLVEAKESSGKILDIQSTHSERKTVWNAKLILMSGLSKNSIEELSSDKVSDDRIPHIYNILRFAILKKDHSFMAIGGPWESNDGGDPSVDNSSLIKTVQRYAKDVTQLDLHNCEHWNRFLEIHYNRIGKDGLFSHKEVTVLFLPNLSECLPSLDAWREQWLAHKAAVAAREHSHTFKREKSRDNKEASKEKLKQKKEATSSERPEDAAKKEKGGDVSKIAIDAKNDENNKKENTNISASAEGSNVVNNEQGGAAISQSTNTVKLVKKKVIRKVVKQKVINKTAGGKQANKVEKKDGVDKNDETSSTPPKGSESSADHSGVKTFVRKKILKNVSTAKASENESKMQTAAKDVKKMDSFEDKLKQKFNPSSDPGVKTTVKRKIIKRIPRKKVSGETSNVVQAEAKTDDGTNAGEAGDAALSTVRDKTVANSEVNEGKSIKKVVPMTNAKTKQNNVIVSNMPESKPDKKELNNVKGTNEKNSHGIEFDKEKVSQKDGTTDKRGNANGLEKSKDEKAKNNKDPKDESQSKSNKESKKKCKSQELPRHPGLILQTKQSEDSKLRSLSLPFDSLLNYTDNDTEESTFELSLFAETLNEMLQYQMGCRILDFLQKLRVRFFMVRAERKRQREGKSEKENVKKSGTKRLKTNELPVKRQPANEESVNRTQQEEKETSLKDDTPTTEEDGNMEHDTDNEEDPEEDPEEYEEMEDGIPQDDISNETKEEGQKDVGNDGSDEVASHEKLADGSSGEHKAESEEKPKPLGHPSEGLDENLDKSKKDNTLKEASVDKDLLQAFRFFDRNQIGYIRVEDMRLMIHNLGKFLTHRDVKELVQSALLETNTCRDDRILYNKLVRMTGI